MSKVEVNQVTQQCGTTLTVGGGACKTAVVDATTVTLGRCGGTVSLASGATQSGFGRTGTVDWITTPKVTGDSPITAVTGKGYFLNTTAGVITINLPAGAAGSIVSMADYAATWQTNNVTVNANGTEKIGGVGSAAVILSTEGQSVTLVYVDAAQGWVNTMDSTSNVRGATFVAATVSGACNAIVTNGDYKTAVFKGPGTFCVSATATAAANNKVDYFVVAGGGSAGGYYAAGAAGGFRVFSTAPGCNSPLNNSGASPNTEITVTASPYAVTVGGGGTAGACAPGVGAYDGNQGSDSVFSTVTSTGGGFGVASGPTVVGGPGGSGGSSGYFRPPAGQGVGNTPPVSPSQGNPGGRASYGTAGGGGGAGAVGGNGTCNGISDCSPHGGPQLGGDGGAGSYIADPFIGPTAPSYGTPGPTGSTRYFAGGGGGGACQAPAPNQAGAGGAGGGGTGQKYPGPFGVAQNATINTGGGGGGSGGGLGGSGIVMIRYKYQ